MDRLRGDQTDITIDQDTVRSTSHNPGAWNYNMSATLYADYRIDSLGKMMSLNYNIFNSDDPARSENKSVTAGKIERLRTSSTGRYRIHALKLDFTLPFKNLYAEDRKSTRLNSSHANISYAVFCLKKKKAPEALANKLGS